MADPTDDLKNGEEIVDEDTNNDQPSFLAMSDEEIMNMAPPPLKPAAEVVVKPADAEIDADAAGGKPAKEAAVDATTEEEEENTEESAATEADKAKAAEAAAKAKATKEATDATVVEKPKEAPAIDYKAEYERLTAPFRANGKEISVGSVDDAIALMQMGANYNKKMAALKPNLKLMKMLENSGFMSEEKIGFLIDLGKKNPAAISKLVKDSGLDPLDLSAEQASAYKQTAYAVDDREIELDTVLDELSGSPTYTRTIDVVSNKWDVASKQAISASPQLLKVIDDHVASGIYDLISTEVERERLFGRLKGLSDIEAYRTVGDSINARGGFNHLVKNQGQPKPAEKVIVPPKPKAEDDKLKDKRRAASSTKPAAPTTTPADFNPLALSDAEFSKLAIPKFR